MSRDFVSFLVVYIIGVLGFGVALRSLFFDVHVFAKTSSTFIALFDASLFNYDHTIFDGQFPFWSLGTTLQITFTVFAGIVLMNLLIAKMSQTYQRISSISYDTWQYSKAEATFENLLIGERSPFSMLPPPLNIVPSLCYFPHYLAINFAIYGKAA